MKWLPRLSIFGATFAEPDGEFEGVEIELRWGNLMLRSSSSRRVTYYPEARD